MSEIFQLPGGPRWGYHNGVIIQGRQLPSDLPVIFQSFLRIKVGLTEASIHEPMHRNISHRQTFRQSIYKNILTRHPHLPIRQYKQLPQVPSLQTSYKVHHSNPAYWWGVGGYNFRTILFFCSDQYLDNE